MPLKDLPIRRLPVNYGRQYSPYTPLLPSTEVNFHREAGNLLDNGIAGSALNWHWRNMQYARTNVVRTRINGTVEELEIVPNHPWRLALDGPAEWNIEYGYYDSTGLMYAILTSLMFHGTCYLYPWRNQLGQVMKFLHVPTEKVTPKSDKYNPYGAKLVSYYDVEVSGYGSVEFGVDELIAIRWGMDPANPRLGVSPLRSALREIAGDNLASSISYALIRNGGVMSYFIVPTERMETLTPAQERAFSRKIQEHSTGDRAGTPTVMDAPFDIKEIGRSPAEIGLFEKRKEALQRILATYGIDPMVLGLETANKTFRNFGEANKMAYYSLLKPAALLLEAQLTTNSLPLIEPDYIAQSLRVSIDLTGITAIFNDDVAQWDKIGKAYTSDVLKRSEARQAMGYPVTPEDEVYYSQTMVGAGQDDSDEPTPGDIARDEEETD